MLLVVVCSSLECWNAITYLDLLSGLKSSMISLVLMVQHLFVVQRIEKNPKW